MDSYDDIINLPHHISKKHPQMSLRDRAAQFAPFAALTGFDASVGEEARLTDKRRELDENMKDILDSKLGILIECGDKPPITVTYFVDDSKKSGGEYVTVSSSLLRVDRIENLIFLSDGSKIPVCDVIDIDSPLSYYSEEMSSENS